MSLFDHLPEFAEPAPSDTPPVDPAARDKLLAVHAILCRTYECPIPYFHHLDPLSELVSSLLSHRTKNADSGRAFKALRAAYPTWSAVRDAPTADVERAIAAVTWPEQKAPRIQAVLRRLTELRAAAGTQGSEADPDAPLRLDFLANWSPADARAFLEQLPGVGPKTSAAVLSFSNLRMRALPVDVHHHRVAARLGLIPAALAVGPSHAALEAMLPPEWSAQEVYDDHEVFMLHGQQCCFHRAPACERCPVLGLCPHGQARVGRVESSDARRDARQSAAKANPDRVPGGPGVATSRADDPART